MPNWISMELDVVGPRAVLDRFAAAAYAPGRRDGTGAAFWFHRAAPADCYSLRMPSSFHIRPASAGDAARLADLVRRTFTETFADSNSAEDLQRIYVLRAWLGLKAGHALLQRCLEEGRHLGAKTIWLGVWEHNHRAQAFYRRNGFTEAGDHLFVVGRDAQRDVVMVKSLP